MSKNSKNTTKAVATADYKTLTVKFNKTENTYEAYDSNGKLYTEEDCPRQIMMHLAYKANQELYFRGKKWRRRAVTKATTSSPKVTVTAQPIPTATKQDASETVAAVNA